MKVEPFDPFWWRDQFVRRALAPILFARKRGYDVLRESWDNLIILDACRADSFAKAFSDVGLKGTLQQRISKGSATNQFVKQNFGLSRNDDVVYVTANPVVDIFAPNRFYQLISVWKDGWDEKAGTVLPETVYDYALEAANKYPGKRLIIHFVQPHHPYIDYNLLDDFEGVPVKIRGDPTGIPIPAKELKHKREIYKMYSANFYAANGLGILREGYENNLRKVLVIAKDLVQKLPGKSVLTADHGEAFGETLHPLIPIQLYGHFPNIKIDALAVVPWFICEGMGSSSDDSNVKRVGSSLLVNSGSNEEKNDESIILERLRRLGYE